MPPVEHTAEKATILVVDDGPETLRLLLDSLGGQGYRVKCARSGCLALSSSQAAPPDLVLLDILMPQMDGFEVCQRLRQHPHTAQVPIIFLSALGDGLDKARAFALGGDDYIVKPFSIAEVLARIKHQLEIKHRQPQEPPPSLDSPPPQPRPDWPDVVASLADGLAVLLGIYGDQGQITDFQPVLANPAFYRLVADPTAPAPQAGSSLLALTAHWGHRALFNLGVAAIAAPHPVRQELLCLRGDRQQWLEGVATRLQDRVVLQLRDITDTQTTLAALRSMSDQLYHLAITDRLTQLANRYRFDIHLQAEWERLGRQRQPLSLLLVDIDKFKRFNDLCGHSLGDRCLQVVAQTLQQALKRPSDLAARYGGEEFALLLPQTDVEGAWQVAAAIHSAIRALVLTEMPVPQCQYVRLSIGISCTIPQSLDPPDALVEAADRALYRAKARGGNLSYLETP